MNLVFRDAVQKTIDYKIIYDLTIQDMDGEVADGRELPFSYVFGQEPVSVIEKYITDHLDELKKVTTQDSFNSDLFKTQNEANRAEGAEEEYDAFTDFFVKAQNKWTEVNDQKNAFIYSGVEFKDDVFVCSHENFYYITNIISFYDSQIKNKLIKKEDVKSHVISGTNTVHILNYNQLLELQKLIFEKMNDIYLRANYIKTIKLNECETVEDLKNFCINFYEDYKNDTIIDNTKDDVNE